MTNEEAKRKVIDRANAEVGYREGVNNWNKYAADLDPLGITYGPKQNQPWCGEFILWLFWECFGVDDALKMLCSPCPSGIPLCTDSAAYFKRAGRWHDTPKVGDIIFFFYSGGINHTGIVTGVSGFTIGTVEGNSSDKVARRIYSTLDSSIAGYGRPRWDAVSDAAPPAEKPKTPVESDDGGSDEEICTVTARVRLLCIGDRGESVEAMQALLILRGCGCGPDGADGDFGPNTERALRAFQEKRGLAVDGICGPATWTALLGFA